MTTTSRTKTLKGSITICRATNGIAQDARIRLSVIDSLSRTLAIEIEMTPSDFALAITGLGYTPCTFEPASPHVGKKHEVDVKKVEVSCFRPSREEMDAALAAHEVDGWMASRKHINHLNFVRSDDGKMYYLAGYDRWVEVEE